MHHSCDAFGRIIRTTHYQLDHKDLGKKRYALAVYILHFLGRFLGERCQKEVFPYRLRILPRYELSKAPPCVKCYPRSCCSLQMYHAFSVPRSKARLMFHTATLRPYLSTMIFTSVLISCSFSTSF